MSKIYMIGEKNGLKYVAHTDSRPLDNATEITKAEYRRHRSAGVPSWGEQLTATEKENARNPKRAAHWAMRKAKAKADALKEKCAYATKSIAEVENAVHQVFDMRREIDNECFGDGD